jgi:hypothetical protein
LWTSNPDLAARWEEVVGTPAKVVPAPDGSRLRDLPRWSRLFRSLRRSSDWPVDSIVFFNIDLAPAAISVRLAGRARPRLVLDLHDYLPSASGR